MIRHCVLLDFHAGTERRAAVDLVDQLHAMAAALGPATPTSFRAATDLGLSETNHDLAIVADFESLDHYRAYAAHPRHLAFIEERLKPVLASRCAVQMDLA